MSGIVPIIDIVQLLADAVGIPAGDVNMRVSVHEDNSGALVLAETLFHNSPLVVSIMLPRLFGFVRRFINGESSF
jgi:hypothetical protein